MAAVGCAGVGQHSPDKQPRHRVVQPVKGHGGRQRIHPGGKAAVRIVRVGEGGPQPLRCAQQTGAQHAAALRVHTGGGFGREGAQIVAAEGQPLPAGQSFQRVEGLGDAAGHVRGGKHIQPVRRQAGQQVQADALGCGGGGRAAPGLVLPAFRRQRSVGGNDLLEVSPGGLGQVGQGGLHVARQVMAAAQGPVQVGVHQRKAGEGRAERQSRPEGRRPQESRARQPQSGQRLAPALQAGDSLRSVGQTRGGQAGLPGEQQRPNAPPYAVQMQEGPQGKQHPSGRKAQQGVPVQGQEAAQFR